MDIKQFLPPELQEKPIKQCIGLMSDTHMPERLAGLPTGLSKIFAGVDLILHAGDVGKLWVLDRLSMIAPIVAVHGNDETAEATRELPYKQVITIEGQRVMLWHSHEQERAAEMELRKSDVLLPKLERIASHGRRAGASIVVFGHWHIPLVYDFGDIFLINPGAFASGNWFTRQTRQTVALLYFFEDESCQTVHVDVAHPADSYTLDFDVDVGFKGMMDRYSQPIVTAELEQHLPDLMKHRFEDGSAMIDVIMRLGHQCWSGKKDCYSRKELLAEVMGDTVVDSADKAFVRQMLMSEVG